MPNYFPCPNSPCQYQFDADMLPPAAMVTCPLCRTKFPYRAAPAPDQQAPAASVPTGPRVVNLRNQPQRGGILGTILWSAGFSIVLIAVLFAVYQWNRHKPYVTKQLNEDRWNFSIDMPSGWEEDGKVRSDMNANIFVKKKTNAEQWVAMFAKDYVERSARPGEIREELLARFKVTRDDPDSPKAIRNLNLVELDGAKWLNKDAIAFEFDAHFNELPIRGECHAVQYKGMVYAFYIFSAETEWESCKGELRAFRDRIKLGKSRENWEEKKRNTQIYTLDGAPYQLEDLDAVWKLGSEEGDFKKGDYIIDPKSIDKHATMAFLARYRLRTATDSRQHAAEAEALVVEIPKGNDPIETAKAHVIERLRKDYDSEVDLKFEPLNKSPAGIALPTDGPAIVRLLLRDPKDRESAKLWIISALNIGDKTVAVESSVRERNAAYVEEWMIHLAASLKAK
jgi:hypothetical protein